MKREMGDGERWRGGKGEGRERERGGVCSLSSTSKVKTNPFESRVVLQGV